MKVKELIKKYCTVGQRMREVEKTGRALRTIWRNITMSKEAVKGTCKALVVLSVLYRTAGNIHRLEAVQMRYLKSMYRVTTCDRVRNEGIRQKMGSAL